MLLNCGFVAETIIKTGNTTLTDLQITVKEWLRHAGNRVRYQRKKELTAKTGKNLSSAGSHGRKYVVIFSIVNILSTIMSNILNE